MSYVEIAVTITAIASVGNFLLQRRWYHETKGK